MLCMSQGDDPSKGAPGAGDGGFVEVTLGGNELAGSCLYPFSRVVLS
jgi:hypothetical protein